MITNLVLSGGGNKCIVFVGALKSLEELGFLSSINKYAGTSGGAIIVLLLVLGYTVSDIIELYEQLNLYDLVNINGDNILHFLDDYGLDSGDKVINILKIVIRKKTYNENITFKELYEQTSKELVISGTCVEKECVEYFNHIHTPDMPVYLAIRISMSFPFFFNRVIYNEYSYIDGGFLEYSSAFLMSETAPIQRPKSPAIPSISLPKAKPFLMVLKAAVAVATAVIGSKTFPLSSFH